MSEQTAAQKAYADIAPAFADISDRVLFGEVWKHPALSPRDRSLATVAALISGYRSNELPYHLKLALQNGVTKDEIVETIIHLAFNAGWPAASTALAIARTAFAEAGV